MSLSMSLLLFSKSWLASSGLEHFFFLSTTLHHPVSGSSSDIDTFISVCDQSITNRVCEHAAGAKLDMARMKRIGTDCAATI